MSSVVSALMLRLRGDPAGAVGALHEVQGATQDTIRDMAAMGLAAAGIGVGIQSALEQSNLKGTLQAKLGLSPADAGKLGDVAGKVYANAWGDSLSQVGDAAASVKQELGGLAGGTDLEGLTTKALALSSVFGDDVQPMAKAAAQMIKTGLVKNSKEAFDVLTVGYQNGTNKAGDLLDTFNEYGTQFRKLGLDGPKALGLLSQGLKGGARDADLVADSLKEFSIRAIDGSKTTSAGFKALGLDGAKMAAQIAKGGPAASAGLQTVLDRLRGIKDPVKQAAAATALFGTQAEDMGKALFGLNPATAAAANGLDKVHGATDRAVKAAGTGPQATLEAFKRQIQTSLGKSITAVLPAVTALLDKIGPFIPQLTGIATAFVAVSASVKAIQFTTGIFSSIAGGVGTLRGAASSAGSLFSGIRAGASGAIGPATSAMNGFGMAVGRGTTALWGHVTAAAAAAAQGVRTAAVWVATKTAQVASAIATGAVTVATGIATAAQWAWNLAMSLNPIGIIIIAVIALIAIIVLIATKTHWFQDAWNVVWGGIKVAFNATVNWFKGAIGAIVGFFVGFQNGVRGAINGAWNWIWGLVLKLAVWERGVMTRIAQVAGFFLIILPSRIRQGIANVVNNVMSLPGRLFTIFQMIVAKVGGIGRDIVTGLWHGISGMGGWLWNQVSNFAKGIIDTIKHTLGIASPSKETDKLGVELPAGLAGGIRRNMGVVHAAAGELSAAALPKIPNLGGDGAAIGGRQGPGQGDIYVTVPLQVDGVELAKILLKVERRTGIVSVTPR